MLSATITGIPEVTARLESPGLRDRVRAAVDQSATQLQGTVKAAYLHGPRPTRLGVKTGRLTRSINIQPLDEPGAVGASVGTNVSYGRVWEFGFSGVEHVSAHTRRVRSRDTRPSKKQGRSAGIAFVRAHDRTVHLAPRPFLRPALADVSDDFRARVAAAAMELG